MIHQESGTKGEAALVPDSIFDESMRGLDTLKNHYYTSGWAMFLVQSQSILLMRCSRTFISSRFHCSGGSIILFCSRKGETLQCWFDTSTCIDLAGVNSVVSSV